MSRPRITFLPETAEAHAAIVAGLAECRDLDAKMQAEARRHGMHTSRYLDLAARWQDEVEEMTEALLAAGMVVDDGEAAEGDA